MKAFDFLADAQSVPDPKDWQQCGTLARAKIEGADDRAIQKSLTDARTQFLRNHFIAAGQSTQRGQGSARVRTSDGLVRLQAAELLPAVPDLACLPEGSATLELGFSLLSPLLTRDDDPFYLFDNPVRKDHIFSAPFLAAASVKGLCADAYRRAFSDQPATASIEEWRGADAHALRLFGIADDGLQQGSRVGRLHFFPVWFDLVQFLVMNPRDPKRGTGKLPIQFEAVAPVDARGQAVRGTLAAFYFNPLGDSDKTPGDAIADVARFIAACAAWLPVLGLGAKRLAGYGAILPTDAVCHAAWGSWHLAGEDSWMKLATTIAEAGE
ncbi:MAG TPA: hypothetical protein PK752_10270 [Accumulibacter sp.]|uniref:hypothetical protein n=1 Tax=Accumulibacter sp. TaxID=2053492 RepID=UPI002C022BE8|nr:hypothetical protein [Accumulibacter sp.]HRD88620.1 hypothetical protein [Accumulibacter sp.]